MNQDLFENRMDRLEDKIDTILGKLSDGQERMAKTETKLNIYTGVINYVGSTSLLVLLGCVGFLLKLTVFA